MEDQCIVTALEQINDTLADISMSVRSREFELDGVFEDIRNETDRLLEEKTGWGRNEVKRLIKDACATVKALYE